jgi:tight adherence protein B
MVTEVSLAAGAAVAAILFAVAAGGSLRRAAAALGQGARRLSEGELADAFIFVDARLLLRASAVTALALAAIAVVLGGSLVGAALFAALLVVGPRLLVRALKRRRQRRLVRQLPDAMQALASLLQAGNSLPQAIARLADTQARPLRDEWRLLLRGLRMGAPSEAVFEQLAQRVDAPEARLLATTVRVALDLGGSLGEALAGLATGLRRRLDMQERIRALTSQGRLQGLIVGALPLLLAAVLTFMDSAAMRLLWTRPVGWAALGVVAALEVCGFILIRRIVRIDV